MLKLTKTSIILLLICSIEANKTIELLEKLINELKEEFDYRLNNAIKVQQIYERRVEEMAKKISGFNEKLYDINGRSCYSKKVRSQRINKTIDETENEIKYLEQNTSESYIISINYI
jgi:predicted adenine nucleotide alpha hydrolase (AANH) superfamily ATPase